VFEPTGWQRDAASVLFNLPGYRVIAGTDGQDGRRVVIESVAVEQACPSCGVLTARVHQWTLQRVRDVPVAGAVDVRWHKRRFVCAERLCLRRTFAEHTAARAILVPSGRSAPVPAGTPPRASPVG
jgi:transposase